MLKKSVIAAIAVCIVLCLSAGTLLAGERCIPVTIGSADFESVLSGPENCNGYDSCGFSVVRGTLNGTFAEYSYDADAVQVDATTYSFAADAVFETNHGELFLEERSIVNFAAPDGIAVVANILGGTGRYEGATGWLVIFANFEGTLSRWAGEVCWPED